MTYCVASGAPFVDKNGELLSSQDSGSVIFKHTHVHTHVHTTPRRKAKTTFETTAPVLAQVPSDVSLHNLLRDNMLELTELNVALQAKLRSAGNAALSFTEPQDKKNVVPSQEVRFGCLCSFNNNILNRLHLRRDMNLIGYGDDYNDCVTSHVSCLASAARCGCEPNCKHNANTVVVFVLRKI